MTIRTAGYNKAGYLVQPYSVGNLKEILLGSISSILEESPGSEFTALVDIPISSICNRVVGSGVSSKQRQAKTPRPKHPSKSESFLVKLQTEKDQLNQQQRNAGSGAAGLTGGPNNKVTEEVVCHNFGHPALTSSFTKYKFLQVKYDFAAIVNERSVLKLLQLSNVDCVNL